MAAAETEAVPMEDVYMAFRPMLAQYETLFVIVDPEEEPYKSKYEARKLMGDWMAKAEAALASSSGSETQKVTILDKIAICQLNLGMNHHETEEVSAGAKLLEKATARFEAREMLEELQEATNLLGIVWCELGDVPKATEFLLRAKAAYELQETHSEKSEEKYTLTLYYLAQANTHGDNTSEAARNIHFTLQRQLEGKGGHWDPVEWSKNCTRLADYYAKGKAFDAALHCFHCAWSLLPEDTADEEKAPLQLAYGRFFCDQLSYALDSQLSSMSPQVRGQYEDRVSFKTANEDGSELDGPDKIKDDGLRFKPEAELPPAPSLKQISDYASALSVFKDANKWLGDAGKYFKLDGTVSEYIEIQQMKSRILKVLAYYETDSGNQCKMHKRRIDALEPIAPQLNTSVYAFPCKQLYFEVAETYCLMFEVKAGDAEATGDVSQTKVKKLNTLALKAIATYQAFIKCFHTRHDAKPDDAVEADGIEWFLTGWLSVARMQSKVLGGNPRDIRDALLGSLNTYKWIIAYMEKHAELCAGHFQQELGVCRQMAELLPQKISELSAQITDAM